MSGGTHVRSPLQRPGVPLRGSHPLRPPVPAVFGVPDRLKRRPCRTLQLRRTTPMRHRRQAVPPHRFGLLPVRSPLLRESSLFLGVLRCFSSPGAPRSLPVSRKARDGLPHSETSGSQAASASPERFAAWPRPSSAVDAKASTMRPLSRPCHVMIHRDSRIGPTRAAQPLCQGSARSPLPRFAGRVVPDPRRAGAVSGRC